MIKKISFEDILPSWKDHLWPGRQSAIEPVSAISHTGEIDMQIFKYKPTFYGYFEGDRLIGVVSGHSTSTELLRIRGLWVHPDFRGQGIASRLILELVQLAKANSHTALWGLARSTSVDFYLGLHFIKMGQTSAYEFGPHVIIKLQILPQDAFV